MGKQYNLLLYYFITPLSAAFLTYFFIYMFRRYAYKLDLVDYPGGHRGHVLPTPLIGGLGIFCGAMTSLFFFPLPLGDLRIFMAGGTLLVVVGVLDDLHDLSSRSRFIGQIAAATLMSWGGGNVLRDLGSLIPGRLVELDILAVPFTVFSTVGVINALNMADGMDGEAGVLSVIALGSLIVLSSGNERDVLLLSMLISTVLIFLIFNLGVFNRKGKVFLGDAGSMYLGFAITWFLIDLSQGDKRVMAPVTALFILAVPLYDTVALLFHRLIEGRSPFQADRDHLHHVLQRMGLPPWQALVVIGLLATGGAVLGIYWETRDYPEYKRFLAFIGGFVGYYLGMSYFWKYHPVDWQRLSDDRYRDG